MSERIKMPARVASLYSNRQKGLDLLKQLEASDLSNDTRDGIIDIMRRMRIIREADGQGTGMSEPPPRDKV